MKAYRKGLLLEKEKTVWPKMLTLTKANVFKVSVIAKKKTPNKRSKWCLKNVIENKTVKKFIVAKYKLL